MAVETKEEKMQRARLKVQTEVEFIKLEKDFTIEAGDFLVIGDIGQEIIKPEDFARRYELDKEDLPPPTHRPSRVGGRRKKRRDLNTRVSQELKEAIDILYAEQCKEFTAEQIADPNHPKGITVRAILESGLVSEHLTENKNKSAAVTHVAYCLLDRKIIVRDKFYVNSEIGKRECWHYRPA